MYSRTPLPCIIQSIFFSLVIHLSTPKFIDSPICTPPIMVCTLLQLTDKGSDPGTRFRDISSPDAPLASLGIHHGSMVYLWYLGERQVKGPALSAFDAKPFGQHMTVERMVAAQTRLERQETPKCASVSFDAQAVNAFQSYVHSAMAFSIKRGGVLYGTIGEGGEVLVHAIYEPPQQGTADSLRMERGDRDEAAADAVADALGWRKVGWIYSQSTKERDFICSAEEICQMAAIQDEMGENAVTAVVALFPPDPDDPHAAPEVHVEAFQVRCLRLYALLLLLLLFITISIGIKGSMCVIFSCWSACGQPDNTNPYISLRICVTCPLCCTGLPLPRCFMGIALVSQSILSWKTYC
jgi:hypothetical protein